MKKAWAIGVLTLRQTIKDRSALVGMVVIPLILTFVLGVAFGGGGTQSPEVPIGIVDRDGSYYAEKFAAVLKGEPTLAVRTFSEAAAEDAVRKQNIAAAIVIPEDFGRTLRAGRATQVSVMALSASSRAIGVREIVTGAADRLSGDAYTAAYVMEKFELLASEPMSGYQGAVSSELPTWRQVFRHADENWEPRPPVQIEFRELVASKERGQKTIPGGFSQTSLGFTIAFILFMLLSGSGGILDERAIGTLGRLLTTPTRKGSIIGGKIIGLFLTGAVQAAILIGAGVLLFKVNWGASPAALALLIAAFILSATGLSVLLSALARTRAQQQALTPILAISMAMLGGSYWPIEIVPPYMQKVAMALPTGWAMRGLVDVVVRMRGFDAVVTPTLVLLGFAAAFFVVGLRLLKFE